MSLPYFNLYPTDFEADTSHLTLEEDGAYNRLLRLCWMTQGCSLPDDDAWIMRRMRVDEETFARVVKVVLAEFFTRQNGRVSNARLAREFSTSNEAHKKRVSAGKMGGEAKASKTNNKTPSNAKAMLYQPEPEPEPLKREAIASPKKPTKPRQKPEVPIPENWVPSDRNIFDAEARQFSAKEIEHEADSFRNHHTAKGSLFRDWDAAWRTWLGNARKFRGRGMAGQASTGRHGQGGSIASIVARRWADGSS
jgi:uncharacterized protein YdaU (DUF1376 family)